MKKVICLAVTSLIVFAASGQKKVTYEFPEEMLPEVKEQYIKLWEKGKILYQLNCAGCHNTFKGRKEIIPDFDVAKVTGYTMRVANAKHESSLPDEQVSEEDLALISVFLIYKKKSTPAKK